MPESCARKCLFPVRFDENVLGMYPGCYYNEPGPEERTCCRFQKIFWRIRDCWRHNEVTTDLHEISELREFNDYREANEYLKLGWRLVSVHIEDCGDPDRVNQQTIYCLGWPRSLGEPKNPWEGCFV